MRNHVSCPLFVAAIGGMVVLGASACALPRERKELLGAEPQVTAGTPAMPDGGDAAPSAPPSSPATPSTSSPTSAAADSGTSSAPRPAGSQQPDASMPASAGPDECGDKFSERLFSDPIHFEDCARMYCRALVPMDAAIVVPDGGVTKEAACAMQFADCLTRNPQMTAECMAKAQQCV